MGHKVEVFLQVVPEWNYNRSRVRGAKVVRMTQSRPIKPVAGCQIVKLVLDLDEDLFMPKTPNIKVSLSKQNIKAPEVVDQEVVWRA